MRLGEKLSIHIEKCVIPRQESSILDSDDTLIVTLIVSCTTVPHCKASTSKECTTSIYLLSQFTTVKALLSPGGRIYLLQSERGLIKAFDTVDHDILCKKFEHYGVQQRELSWFRSYLSNRKQFCRINGVDSNVGEIEVGVPQGSCLGPLLFLIYINDLPQAVQHSSVTMYADDTSLCYQSRDLTQLNEAINSDLKKLETWLQGNKLSLNVAKLIQCSYLPSRKAALLGVEMKPWN